jgi:hypothetical protein
MKRKINFNELEKLNYEEGKKLLLESGYIQDHDAVDEHEDYDINDEYYTLYDDEGNETHVLSYVTYTKITDPEDEPLLVNQGNWHWSEVN